MNLHGEKPAWKMFNKCKQLWGKGLKWALDFSLKIRKDHLVCCFILQIKKTEASRQEVKSHTAIQLPLGPAPGVQPPGSCPLQAPALALPGHSLPGGAPCALEAGEAGCSVAEATMVLPLPGSLQEPRSLRRLHLRHLLQFPVMTAGCRRTAKNPQTNKQNKTQKQTP